MTQLDEEEMALSPFSRNSEKSSREQPLELELQVSHQGAIYRSSPNLENWIERLDLFGEDAFAVALLSQLDEIGLIERFDDTAVLTWGALYRYLEENSDATESLLSNLKLPQMKNIRPSLNSSGSLEDKDFKVTLGTWSIRTVR